MLNVLRRFFSVPMDPELERKTEALLEHLRRHPEQLNRIGRFAASAGVSSADFARALCPLLVG